MEAAPTTVVAASAITTTATTTATAIATTTTTVTAAAAADTPTVAFHFLPACTWTQPEACLSLTLLSISIEAVRSHAVASYWSRSTLPLSDANSQCFPFPSTMWPAKGRKLPLRCPSFGMIAHANFWYAVVVAKLSTQMQVRGSAYSARVKKTGQIRPACCCLGFKLT